MLELNQFILPFRQAFTFESSEVVQAGTGAAGGNCAALQRGQWAEVVAEATFSAANGFGLASILSPAELPNANQGAAIVAEQDALLDTLDAVKDLLMAENAFQLVSGNFDRVAAVSLAQKEAHIPPELEVIETPRGTEFTFTNRVTLHFDDLDPALPANNPWLPDPDDAAGKSRTGNEQVAGSYCWARRRRRLVCKVHWVEKRRRRLRRHSRFAVHHSGGPGCPADRLCLAGQHQPGRHRRRHRIGDSHRLQVSQHHNIGDDKIDAESISTLALPGKRHSRNSFHWLVSCALCYRKADR